MSRVPRRARAVNVAVVETFWAWTDYDGDPLTVVPVRHNHTAIRHGEAHLGHEGGKVS